MRHCTFDEHLASVTTPGIIAFGPQGREALVHTLCEKAGARLMTFASCENEMLPDFQSGARVAMVFAEEMGPGLDALLERLDRWSDRSGAAIIADVDADLLDPVCARLGSPDAQITCGASASELLTLLQGSLGEGAAAFHDASSERSALQLRKLSEDVDRIARTLATLSADREIVMIADDALDEADDTAATDEGGATELIRAMLRARRLRERFFAPELFSDPAWDMLLDLAAAALERKRVAVSSLCIAASVPPTTALRYIKTMTDTGLFVRRPDRSDGRRVFIELSDHALGAMLRYLGAVRRTIDVVD